MNLLLDDFFCFTCISTNEGCEFVLKKIRLSKRLEMVASFVPEASIVADIGSDHAYLPCYLVQNGIIQHAIAGEVAKGPYESAVKNVSKEGFEQQITVRLANGLSAIEDSDDVDTVTIAGMGGTLIATILTEGSNRLQNVKRIIAQPNIHAIAIREWAVKNEWRIIDERILKEDGKIYEIIVLERGNETYSEIDLLTGPFLHKEQNTYFIEKWNRELAEWERILSVMENAENSVHTNEKKEQLNEQIHLIRKVLSKSITHD